MNPDRIDPSTERLVIREILKVADTKAAAILFLGIIIGGAGATLIHVVLATRLVDICL